MNGPVKHAAEMIEGIRHGIRDVGNPNVRFEVALDKLNRSEHRWDIGHRRPSGDVNAVQGSMLVMPHGHVSIYCQCRQVL
jgi:hypothetical protein